MIRRFGKLALIVVLAGCGDDTDTFQTGPNQGGPDSGVDSDALPEAADEDSGVEPVHPEDYLDRSLCEQVEVMESMLLTSAALTSAYLQRIEERDRGDDGLHAVLALDPNASAMATAADQHRGSGALLQGAVILLKDNVDTEGLATTAGSLAMVGNVPAADAPIVARLRQARAVIVGKANLSEWANARGAYSTSGWSSLGGQTRNGANPSYNPCGSSSGSAAAVAAGLVSASIGTETDGSIVCPASVNGVVGFKPTVGLLSRTGIIPISHSQDTAGPLTRNVRDAARLLTVMAGADPSDIATSDIPTDLELDFEAGLDDATFSGMRLGVVDNLMGYHDGVDALFEAQVAMMEGAGATIVHVSLPSWTSYAAAEMTVLTYELKHDLNEYLASHAGPGQPGTLAELIAFNDAHADEVMPYFGQEFFLQAEATTGLEAPEYLEAKQVVPRVIGEEGIDAVIASNTLDALICPTSGPAWKTDYAKGDRIAGVSSSPAAIAGAPHLTVPMGTIEEGQDSLPVGLSIFASRWRDGAVLVVGEAYEAVRDGR